MMEKLIELLNEYEIEREEKIDSFKDKEKPLWERYIDCTNDLTFEPTDKNEMNWEYFSWDTAHSVIISKSYWFIKRLADHDKIDFQKVNKVYYEKIYCWFDWKYQKFEDFMNEEILLMRLSIQESPIEFLVGVLK